MFYLQIFRIQDPESSGSKDPAGKSQEGQTTKTLETMESPMEAAQQPRSVTM